MLLWDSLSIAILTYGLAVILGYWPTDRFRKKFWLALIHPPLVAGFGPSRIYFYFLDCNTLKTWFLGNCVQILNQIKSTESSVWIGNEDVKEIYRKLDCSLTWSHGQFSPCVMVDVQLLCNWFCNGRLIEIRTVTVCMNRWTLSDVVMMNWCFTPCYNVYTWVCFMPSWAKSVMMWWLLSSTVWHVSLLTRLMF